MRRSRERHLIGAFILIAAFGAVGNFDYADAISVDADKKLARASYALLLDTSSRPATLDECQRAAPEKGRPARVVSQQHRTNEAWQKRTCGYGS